MKLIDISGKIKLKFEGILDEVLSIRLKDFGFKNNVIIEVLSRTKGMYLLKVNNSVYAINDTLAKLILVQNVK